MGSQPLGGQTAKTKVRMVTDSLETFAEQAKRRAGNRVAPNQPALMDRLRVLAFVVTALMAPGNVLPAWAAEPAASSANARAPFMLFSAPTNGQAVPFLNVLYINGKAFSSGGVVTQVLYFVNGQFIGAGAGANWLRGWFATNLGPHVVSARLIDDKGRFADTMPILVEVKTFPPQLILRDRERREESIDLQGEAILPLGSTNWFHAALDVFFPVQTIDLLVDGRKQNDPRTFPDLIWIPTRLGPHRLEAVVADASGLRLTSNPVMVTIADVQTPSLTILSPAPKSCFARGSPITFRAMASDSKGHITKLAIEGVGQTNLSNRGPTIEGVVTNLSSGWHRIEVTAVNDSAQRARQFLDVFVAYEENLALPTPDGFAGEADDASIVTLTWKRPTAKGAAVWLTVEQREDAGEWIDILGCSINDDEFLATELKAETIYAFRIAFLDRNHRRSAYSPIVRLKTPPWTTVPAHFPVKQPR